jgi:hypothetical protein
MMIHQMFRAHVYHGWRLFINQADVGGKRLHRKKAAGCPAAFSGETAVTWDQATAGYSLGSGSRSA